MKTYWMFVDRSGCSRHQGRKGQFLKGNNVIREKKQSSKCTTWYRVKKKDVISLRKNQHQWARFL